MRPMQPMNAVHEAAAQIGYVKRALVDATRGVAGARRRQ
jgi:hypothetical protein